MALPPNKTKIVCTIGPASRSREVMEKMLRALTGVLGIDEPGMLLGIVGDDQQGQMKRIVDAITEEKIRFGSILVSRHWEEGKRAFFPYLFTHNILQLKKKLEALGFTFINPLEWYLRDQPTKIEKI